MIAGEALAFLSNKSPSNKLLSTLPCNSVTFGSTLSLLPRDSAGIILLYHQDILMVQWYYSSKAVVRSRDSNPGDSTAPKVCILDPDVVRDNGRVRIWYSIYGTTHGIRTNVRLGATYTNRLAWCMMLARGMRARPRSLCASRPYSSKISVVKFKNNQMKQLLDLQCCPTKFRLIYCYGSAIHYILRIRNPLIRIRNRFIQIRNPL